MLGRRDGAVELLVRDDGRGFDPALTARVRASAGCERAVLVGAELQLEAAPHSGTEVRLRLKPAA